MRPILSLLIAAILVTVLGCANTDDKLMQTLLEKLSHGPESELPSMIYGYQHSSPGAQKVLLNMLSALRPPSPEQHMKFVNSHHSGKFTLVVAHVPWHKGPYAYEYQPIILTRESGHDQVVGYILPFDDIFSLVTQADLKDIIELNQWYLQKYTGGVPGGGMNF